MGLKDKILGKKKQEQETEEIVTEREIRRVPVDRNHPNPKAKIFEDTQEMQAELAGKEDGDGKFQAPLPPVGVERKPLDQYTTDKLFHMGFDFSDREKNKSMTRIPRQCFGAIVRGDTTDEIVREGENRTESVWEKFMKNRDLRAVIMGNYEGETRNELTNLTQSKIQHEGGESVGREHTRW